MISYACPTCSNSFELATLGVTMASCPSCKAEVKDPQATAVPLNAKTGAGAIKQVARVALSKSFRARYRLQKPLGAGASGAVYLAADVQSGEHVAIKFLVTLDDENALLRFMREGEMLARLTDPRIVRVHALAEEGGHPYLVTDYLPGGTLSDLLQREQRLAPERAAELCAEILRGLAACHEAGMIHRDVKPANVLFGKDGQPRVADFGLARLQQTDERVTQTGALLGTPRYIAPEVVRGEPAGPASDIYAVGVMLFEMIAGRAPFLAPDVYGLLHLHATEPPPPLERENPAVTEALAALVASALAKDPDQRPRDAATFARLLEASVDPAQASRARAHKRRVMRLAVAVTALTALVGGAYTYHRLPRARVDEVESLYLSAYANDPRDFVALNNLALLYEKRGQLADAIEFYAKAVDVRPDSAIAQDNLGIAYEKLKRWPEAERHYRKAVELDPKFAKAVVNLATILQLQTKLADAEPVYRKALELEPANALVLGNLGALLSQTGRHDEGLKLLLRSLELKPKVAIVWRNLGGHHERVKNLPEAERAYREAIAINPKWSLLHNQLGIVCELQGKLKEAEAAYLAATPKRDQHSAKAHNNLAAMILKQDRVSEAERHFRAALEIDPKFVIAVTNLGAIHERRGELADAEKHYRRALELDPKHAQAQSNLAAVLEKRQKR
jgi:tetratricopeptide (TPR) repeat protein